MTRHVCHRPIKDPASLARETGPKCWAGLRPAPARTPKTSRRGGLIPGQLELTDPESAHTAQDAPATTNP